MDLWFATSLGIRVWWDVASGWASFFNHGWTRMNADVLRGIESQDLSVWIGVDLWFVTSLGISVWWEVAGG